MTASTLTAAEYRELVKAADDDEREIDAETYRARYAASASDLLPRNKYRNEPVEVDGHRFDSVAEARRYRDLTRLRDAGEISQLRLQPRYPIVVNGVTICTYVADFEYLGRSGIVVEDVKSSATKTPVYRLKNKLMRAVHGIEITEVER